MADTPDQGGTGNPILDSQGIKPLGSPLPPGTPQAGPPTTDNGAGALINNIANPAPPAQAGALPDLEGKSDEEIQQILATQNFETRLAQGKLFAPLFGGDGTVTYANAPSSGGGGGGYKYDPATIDEVIKRAEKLREETMEDRNLILRIQNCQAPAPDVDSSEMQAKATRQWGDFLAQKNTEQYEAYDRTIKEFTDAKKQYMEQERITQDQWQRLTKGMQA